MVTGRPIAPFGPSKTISAPEAEPSRFFKHAVAIINGDPVTTKDVVQYVANYGGAVHKSTPDTPMTKALEHIAKTLQFGGSPSVLCSLRGISDVSVGACSPLYSVIKEEAAA